MFKVKPRSWTTRPVTNKGIGEHYHGDRVDTIATPFRTPVDLQCGRPTSPKDPACYSFLKSLSCSVTDATKHPDCIRFDTHAWIVHVLLRVTVVYYSI